MCSANHGLNASSIRLSTALVRLARISPVVRRCRLVFMSSDCESCSAKPGCKPLDTSPASPSIRARSLRRANLTKSNPMLDCGSRLLRQPGVRAGYGSARAWQSDFGYFGVAFNYRMRDAQAAVGRTQLGKPAQLVTGRPAIASPYPELLGNTEGLRLPLNAGSFDFLPINAQMSEGNQLRIAVVLRNKTYSSVHLGKVALMDAPTVSFIVPCYNLAHVLPECVNSILAQSYRQFEISHSG